MFFYLQITIGIIMIFILFFMRGGLENPIYSLLKLKDTKFDQIVTRLRFYIPWDLFCNMNENFMDIKITSYSDKSYNTWFLKKDKCVGNYYFGSNLSSLTLTFYYQQLFHFFLNEFCLNKIQEFYYQKNDICKSLIIEKHWFNSYNQKSVENRLHPINIETIFHWNK